MLKLSEKRNGWMLPAVLILFVLVILTAPLVLGYTYSGRSEALSHFLIYTPGRLTWDSATGIDKNGAAIFSVFSNVYADGASPDVVSADGDNVIAPGTGGFNIVRLKNNVGGSIKYTAVLYSIKTNDTIPVKADMNAPGASATAAYPLPAGVAPSQVINAVGGILAGGAIQDFDTSWVWNFYESSARDALDTELGNASIPDEITLGLYIVVEDGNSYIAPNVPRTGDENQAAMYAALLAISLFMAVILIVEQRRNAKDKCEEQAE